MQHLDATLTLLSEGDWVITLMPNYRELVPGRIIKVTEKRVRVAIYSKTSRYHSKKEYIVCPKDTVKLSSDAIDTLKANGSIPHD